MPVILYHHSINFSLPRVFMIGLDYMYASKLVFFSIFVWTSLNREYKLDSFVSSIYLPYTLSTSYLASVTPKKQNIHFPPRFLWVTTKCSLSSGSHFDKTMEMQSTKESKPGFLSILSGEWIDVPETDRVGRSKFETAFMLLFFNQKRKKWKNVYF